MRFVQLMPILVLICVQISDTHPPQRKKREIRGLYSTEDDVEILTSDNFKSSVYGSKTAWFIEFYVSWCGDCQRFAPAWKGFARNVTGWSNLVTIGVVECSLPLNTPLCRKFQVARYPTLRYFKENYVEGPDHLGVKIDESDETVEGHKRKLIAQIRKDQVKNTSSIYPSLLYYNKSSIEGIFQDKPKDVKFGFLVFEDDSGPYIGAEVALDLSKTKTVVKSASKNNKELLKSLHVTTSPSIVLLDYQSKNFTILSEKADSTEQVKDIITKFLLNNKVDILQHIKPKKQISTVDKNKLEQTKKHETVRGGLREHIKKMGDAVFQVDLETALRQSLKHEVAVTEVISGEKLDALRKLLKVLEKYFPFGPAGKKFLSELSKTVSSADQVEGRKIAELVETAEAGRGVFSSAHQFLGCEGSSKTYRGYPCSLWKLFHFLTVNADQENFDNEVLRAMHGYIKNFFGCSGCSDHFQEMAKRRNLEGVSSADFAILWLWTAHNEVNGRLAGDPTEDPEYKKYQFPSIERCPECVNYNDKNFIKQEVLNYLKSIYSRYSLNYLGSDTTVLFEGLDPVISNYESDKNSTSSVVAIGNNSNLNSDKLA